MFLCLQVHKIRKYATKCVTSAASYLYFHQQFEIMLRSLSCLKSAAQNRNTSLKIDVVEA